MGSRALESFWFGIKYGVPYKREKQKGRPIMILTPMEFIDAKHGHMKADTWGGTPGVVWLFKKAGHTFNGEPIWYSIRQATATDIERLEALNEHCVKNGTTPAPGQL